MGISEGKITLYTAAAGVNPMQVRTWHRLRAKQRWHGTATTFCLQDVTAFCNSSLLAIRAAADREQQIFLACFLLIVSF
jgi:hypothetical protein